MSISLCPVQSPQMIWDDSLMQNSPLPFMTLVFQMYECKSLTSSSACAANRLDEYLPTIIGPQGPIDRRKENGDHPRSQPHTKTTQNQHMTISTSDGAEERRTHTLTCFA